MLNRTINIRNNGKPNVFTFKFKNVETLDDFLYFHAENSSGISGNRDIRLIRQDGKSIYYAESLNAEFKEENGTSKIIVKAFPKRILFPKKIRKIKINENPADSAKTINGYAVEFLSEHYFNNNRNDDGIFIVFVSQNFY